MNALWPIFHPRKALRAMTQNEELTLRLSALDEKKEELEKREKALVEELEASRRMAAQEQRRAETFRERLTQMEARSGEADRLRDELTSEREETRRAVAEITRRLEGVEKMRAGYERRIAHLRHALAESREQLRLYSTLDPDGAFIDMRPGESNEIENAKLKAENSGSDPAPDDWLMPLP